MPMLGAESYAALAARPKNSGEDKNLTKAAFVFKLHGASRAFLTSH